MAKKGGDAWIFLILAGVAGGLFWYSQKGAKLRKEVDDMVAQLNNQFGND